MAGSDGSSVPQGGLSRFIIPMANQTPSAGTANRDPMGILLYPSGRGVVNVGGYEGCNHLAANLHLDVERFAVKFGGHEATNQVACFLVDPATPGAIAVRRNKARKTLTIYMHNLFKEMPRLRPATRRWCALGVETEENSQAMVIYLGVALERRTVARGSSSAKSAPEPQTP